MGDVAVKNSSDKQHLSELTDKQAKFVIVFCTNGFNATQAAIEAGYRGNSDNQHAVVGTQNIRKPKVLQAIQDEMLLQVSSLGWDRNRYVLTLQSILQLAINDKAWPSALAALKEMGALFDITDKTEDTGITIKLFSDSHQSDDPAQRLNTIEHQAPDRKADVKASGSASLPIEPQ